MLKMNLQDSFKEFCEKKKFEINESQIEIINLLDKFLIHKQPFLSRLFKKRKTLFLFTWKSRSR